MGCGGVVDRQAQGYALGEDPQARGHPCILCDATGKPTLEEFQWQDVVDGKKPKTGKNKTKSCPYMWIKSYPTAQGNFMHRFKIVDNKPCNHGGCCKSGCEEFIEIEGPKVTFQPFVPSAEDMANMNRKPLPTPQTRPKP